MMGIMEFASNCCELERWNILSETMHDYREMGQKDVGIPVQRKEWWDGEQRYYQMRPNVVGSSYVWVHNLKSYIFSSIFSMNASPVWKVLLVGKNLLERGPLGYDAWKRS